MTTTLSAEDEAFTSFVAALPDEEADRILDRLDELEAPAQRAVEAAEAALSSARLEASAQLDALTAAQSRRDDAVAATARARAALEAAEHTEVQRKEETLSQSITYQRAIRASRSSEEALRSRQAEASSVRHAAIERLTSEVTAASPLHLPQPPTPPAPPVPTATETPVSKPAARPPPPAVQATAAVVDYSKWDRLGDEDEDEADMRAAASRAVQAPPPPPTLQPPSMPPSVPPSVLPVESMTVPRGGTAAEAVLRLMEARHPELAGLEQRSAEAMREALAARADEVAEVAEHVTRRRRAAAGWWPTAEATRARHEEGVQRELARGKPVPMADEATAAADGSDATAYATLARTGSLRVAALEHLWLSAAPCHGLIVSGVMAGGCFRFVKPSGAEGVCALLRAPADGSVLALHVHGCSGTEAEALCRAREGTTVSVLHPWLTRDADGDPVLRVDDAASVHVGLPAAALLGAITNLINSSPPAASPESDPGGGGGAAAAIEVALQAKAQGTAAFKGGRLADAFSLYSRGLAALLWSEDVPLDGFGLLSCQAPSAAPSAAAGVSAEPRQPAPSELGDELGVLLRAEASEARALVGALLTNRAATALRLGQRTRALADSSLALALTPSPKTAVRRAQALLSVGACAAALEALGAYEAADAEVAALAAKARERAATLPARLAAFLCSPPDRMPRVAEAAAPPADLRHVGGVRVSHLGRRGVTWVASERLRAGALLLVEPAAVHAPPQPPAADASSAAARPPPLLSAIRSELARGGSAAAELRDQLCCMRPTSEEVDERGEDADGGALAWSEHGARAAGAELDELDEREAQRRHLQRLVRRHGHHLAQRAYGEPLPCGFGLFPLSSLCEHACLPNASVACAGPHANLLVTRAARDIEAGEAIVVSYIDLASGFVGARRRSHLFGASGLVCVCPVCEALPDSALYEEQRARQALVCPHDAAHILLPSAAYARRPEYACSEHGCAGALAAAAAAAQTARVHAAFEGLRSPYECGAFEAGCAAAREAQRMAKAVLAPSHHLWMLWVAAATALAGAAKDAALLTTALATRRAMGASGDGAGDSMVQVWHVPRAHLITDEDVSLRVQHAIALGLGSAAAAATLRHAHALDHAASAAPAAAFVDRWIPTSAPRVRAAAAAALDVALPASGGGERRAAAAGQPSAVMIEEWERMEPSAKQAVHALAARRLGERAHWQRECALAAGGAAAAADAMQPQSKQVRESVWSIEGVFSEAECERICCAVDAAAARRGGWDRDRHGRYPTTDMPVSEAADVEAMVRSRLFARVLRPLAPKYIDAAADDAGAEAAAWLPEHLEFRDLFYVKYSSDVGEQRDLAIHTDGSIFSFNVLLNSPSAFEGGGTLFEPTQLVARPTQRGNAVGHSGQVRHGARPITRGERYLIVGFVGCKSGATYEPSERGVRHAAAEAYSKFGRGAWDRATLDAPASFGRAEGVTSV